MKDAYNFSKGQRGKFFREDIQLNLPVYLDDEVMAFVQSIAHKKNLDIQTVVNQLLRGDMMIAELMQ